ncbi:5631_t:CDS:2 [Cetraspora pellucida]|uniref:5631_t:CDS:1 n=1 Tax=Cetraspora pellucida TaxID=1433469 RepID=A0A9N9GU00_9GLOM|nr:5631_t:CDS:2 [Cetraspora pellucida]
MPSDDEQLYVQDLLGEQTRQMQSEEPGEPSPNRLKKLCQTEAKKKLFLKIDLQKIEIFANDGCTHNYTNGSRKDSMSFLVKYQRNEVSLCLFGYKHEVVIPWPELKGFRLNATSRVLTIKLDHGFLRLYYFHKDGFPYMLPPVTINSDPTNGILSNAIGFCLYPKPWEHSNTLMVAEAGINRLCFVDMNKENELLIVNKKEQDEPNISYDKISIQCVFESKLCNLTLPISGTFADFLTLVNQQFGVSPEWIEYCDRRSNEKISIANEEDWKIAKNGYIKMRMRVGNEENEIFKIFLTN